MCNFFSVVSDGKGAVQHFTPEQIVNEMAKGNPSNYDWNSHTSLMHFLGIKGTEEDKMNKWEYSPETKELKEDNIATTNDREAVQVYLDKYFEGKNVLFFRNLYGRNSGNRNSGNRNSGDGNSGNGIWNSFCTKRLYVLFNKPCTEKEYLKTQELPWSWFVLNEWVYVSNMTEKEKTDNPSHKYCDGFLRKFTYKEAWSKCPSEFLDNVKKLKNFDAKMFEEISGIKVKQRAGRRRSEI